MGINIYYGIKRGLVKMFLPILTNLIVLLLFSAARGLWGSVLTKWVFADLSLVMVRIIVLVLLYAVVVICLKLLAASLHLLTKLPLLHFANRLLGVCAGFVSGILWLWLFLALIYIAKDTQLGEWALPQIQQSTILISLYEHNLITYIVAEL
jgi:hypothetical protein